MNKISVVLIVFVLMLGGCCNEDFITPGGDYDFLEGALDVTDLMNSCSADEAYTTEGATPDGEDSSCGGPENNRWFKVTAPGTGELWIYVFVAGTRGTQRESVLTLWDTDGTTQLDCQQYFNPDDYVYISYGPVTPGEVYFFSVDSTSDTSGTFSVCVYDSD